MRAPPHDPEGSQDAPGFLFIKVFFAAEIAENAEKD
jgi:hypothetical protein